MFIELPPYLVVFQPGVSLRALARLRITRLIHYIAELTFVNRKMWMMFYHRTPTTANGVVLLFLCRSFLQTGSPKEYRKLYLLESRLLLLAECLHS
jgi:hypothetical protein